jgi:cytochrome c553
LPTFPRLAGQQNDYLSAQLKAFRDKTRADPDARTSMWGMAASLDDAMIERLAAYYAAQEPVSGSAQDPTDVAAGKKIYEQGVPDKILPCMACHGAKAEGASTTPRLAGQDRSSLERQLSYYATDKRVDDVVMHEEAINLTAQQMTAVSAYLAAQSEGKPSAAAQGGPLTQAQVEDTARVCSSCHGFGGTSVSTTFTFPRLAGQQKDYLSAQLKAFRDKTRDDPDARTYMWGRAASLDDVTIERLAAYYAAQTPLSGSARDPTEVAAGKKIYEQGVPDKILPCMACHGAKAEGAGTTPRLAGQHRLYLERRLAHYATDARVDVVMHQEAINLTAQQMTAVSAYLAAQSESKPSAAAQEGPLTQAQVAETARVCSSCHGFGGTSVSTTFTFPRLAGQQKDYLSAQLKAFRDKTRDDPDARTYMWGRAASLDDAMIKRLAAYYAAQTPLSGSAQDPTDVAAGKKIYEQGIRDKIPPCLTCHGTKAEGAGTRPRLAGQHRLYLERRLAHYATDARVDMVMHQEAINLTAQQMTAISAYLAAQ